MKMIWIAADVDRLPALEATLEGLGVTAYTVLPVLEGRGRTGIHAGDRVHPGALALLLSALEDARADTVFDALAQARDAAGDGTTRFFLTPVERQA